MKSFDSKFDDYFIKGIVNCFYLHMPLENNIRLKNSTGEIFEIYPLNFVKTEQKTKNSGRHQRLKSTEKLANRDGLLY